MGLRTVYELSAFRLQIAFLDVACQRPALVVRPAARVI